MMPGALFVMMPGLMWMPALSADSWATPDSVSDLFMRFGHHKQDYTALASVISATTSVNSYI